MGFLAGVVGELNRREDKAARREEFMMNLLEKRKAAIIPQLVERIEKRNAKVEEKLSRLKTATSSYGFTDEAAAILETTGQLGTILSNLPEPAKTSKTGIQILSETVVSSLKEDQIASAMEYAFDAGYAENPTSDKLIDAIFANSSEEFESVLSGINVGGSSVSRPSLGSLDINERALLSRDVSGVMDDRKVLKDTLAEQLGVTVTDAGAYIAADDPAAADILQNALSYYDSQMSDPSSQRDSGPVLQEIYTIIDSTIERGVSLDGLARNKTLDPNFEYGLTDATLPSGVPIQPVAPVKDAVQTLVDEALKKEGG